MVAWAYIMFEIERPAIAVEELNTRESLWRATAEALSAAGTSMGEIVQGVTAVNEGPGAHKFAEFMAGTSASPDAIGKAKDDAGEFAAACAAAAQELTDTVTAMDAFATVIDARIQMAKLNPLVPQNDVYDYVKMRSYNIGIKMHELQKSAAEKIEGIFSFAVDIPSDV